MRYILYLFTMALIFVGGMLVGNVYLPARNASLATAIAVPGEPTANDALFQCTLPQAERNLHALNQALTSCPVVVNEEKDRLIRQINVLLARQDFEIKKARYELEIAKNVAGTRTTSEFAKASNEYAASLAYLEQLVNTYFAKPKEEAADAAKAETAPVKPDEKETAKPDASATQTKDPENAAPQPSAKPVGNKETKAQVPSKKEVTSKTLEPKPAQTTVQKPADIQNTPQDVKQQPAATIPAKTEPKTIATISKPEENQPGVAVATTLKTEESLTQTDAKKSPAEEKAGEAKK